jgi:hypothetical protein
MLKKLFMVGQYISLINMLMRILYGLCLMIFLQGCACSFGWGHSTVSSKGYFPQQNWSDSSKYYQAMTKFGKEHAEFKLTTNEISEYLNNQQVIFVYEEIDSPICLENKPCVCLHYWYLILRDKQTVYKIGLYDGGFAIKQVYIRMGSTIKLISQYELCAMQPKDRKRIQKEIINNFEAHLLPVMKQYFE